MTRMCNALLASLAAAVVLSALPSLAAPSSRPVAAMPAGSPGGAYRPSHPGGGRPAHPGGHSGHHGHYSGYRGHYGGYYPYWGYYPGWAWGVGIGLGTAWASGWYEPGWGYPSYSQGPAYGTFVSACELDEDCMRARFSAADAPAPSTEVPPPAFAAEGAPTQRPLHLNHCDSARAWFPQVRTCPGGWRLVLPEYNR